MRAVAALTLIACGGAQEVCPDACPEGQLRGDDCACYAPDPPLPDETEPPTDDGDCGDAHYPAPTLLDVIEVPTCEEGMWTYYAETLGWTSGDNLVNSWDMTAPAGARHNEEHDLPSIAHGPCNQWDALQVEVEAEAADYTRNVASRYSCEQGPALVHAVRIYDVDGAYADCAIFSSGDPDGVQQVLEGEYDAINPVTRPDQISAANCEVW